MKGGLENLNGRQLNDSRPSAGRLKSEVALWGLAVPRAILSTEFRHQIELRRKYFPHLRGKYRAMRSRNWGTDLSITLTGFFSLPMERLTFSLNAEVLAHFQSVEASRDFYASARENKDWSQEEAAERRRRTLELLAADPAEFFSEVSLTPEGLFRITDGHHRATIAVMKGRQDLRVIHTVKVHRF